MNIECSICERLKPEQQKKQHFKRSKKRPDGVSYQIDIYHPSHRVEAQVGDVTHRFFAAEVVSMGRGNFSDGINRLHMACNSFEHPNPSDKSVWTYFIRQEKQEEKIWEELVKSYQEDPKKQ
jgi:hypothetical protein